MIKHQPPQLKKVSGLTVLIIIAAIASLAVTSIMFINIMNRTTEINQFEKKRQQAFAMMEQFEEGSTRLATEAKAYCDTKDFVHLTRYMYELNTNRSRDYAIQAIYRLSFTTREISRVQDAKIASDNLSNLEIHAMMLVALSNGVTEDKLPKGMNIDNISQAERNMTPQQQYEAGVQYISSTSYFTQKTDIDSDIRTFSSELMQHYGQVTQETTSTAKAGTGIAFSIVFVLVLLMLFIQLFYNRMQKKNEEMLSEAVTRAEHASKAKGEFLSNMSHDIRTPMNAIVGMTNMAIQNMEEKDYAKVNSDLKIVKSSSNQLLGLINDVLDISKIESGNMVLAQETFSIPLILNEINQTILPLCVSKNQTYRMHIVRLKHEFVISDEVRMRQVLINLLNNAYKYTLDGGQIDAYIEEIEVNDTGATYEFKIKDNGIGIAKDHLDRIFESFNREVNTTINRVEGTGLGLSIVKKVVEAANGTVTVESEKGQGSTFTVRVPMKFQNENEAVQRYAELAGRKIIVTEEQPSYGEDICWMLNQAGADCRHMSEYKDAAAEAKLYPECFVMLILDHNAKASELINWMRQQLPKQLLVFVVCENEMQQFDETAASFGADAMLERPIFKSVLYHKLLEAMQNKNLCSSSEKFLLNRHVLVVDDVEVNRMVAALMLEHAGAVVEQAETGLEAVGKFTNAGEGYYDIILMDIMMPGMNGYEATKRIRSMKRNDAATTLIVALTANAFSDDIQKSLDAGMDGHINKPIEIEDVRSILVELLKKKEEKPQN